MIDSYIQYCMNQWRSNDFNSEGGEKHETKFPVRSPKFRSGTLTFSINLLNKDF